MVAFCSVRDCAAGFVPARPQPEAWYRGSGPATGAGYPVAMPGAAIADNVLSPSQLNALARSLLEDAFPVVLVEGERSEEHTSELQSLMRISYAVFCLKKKTNNTKRAQVGVRVKNEQDTMLR